ncbi:MAG: hypothetical protein FD180_2064 [Planctomycetota bacterium]|nr:MAG: hypothetical protein FD180_2064 [Planctomycetota bacterium]
MTSIHFAAPRVYSLPVRAVSFVLLLLVPLTASGEDWEARCRELTGGTPALRRAAQNGLRRAVPEAAAPLAVAAASDDRELANAAALVVAARKWDPDALLVDLEPLRAVESGGLPEVAEAVAQLVSSGSMRTEEVVGRLIAARTGEDVAKLLGVLLAAPPRDSGWARVAAGRLLDGNREVRRAAARVIQAHGNWRESVDLRRALTLEKDPSVLADLWRTAVEIARGPEDLPLLPDDPELRFEVLSMMAGDRRRPRMVQAAWQSWNRRRPAMTPDAFAQDAARLVRHGGPGALAEALTDSDWSGDLSPTTMEELSGSPLRQARLSALHRSFDGAPGFARAAALLDDPDNELRERADDWLTDNLDAWWDDEPRDRIPKFQRLARAARLAVDSGLGLGTPEETAWAAREIVTAGRASSAMATLAVEMLASMGPDGRDALLELESDPDLGAAAANARRVIDLELFGGIDYEDGLDSRPWLDWYAFRVPWNRWKMLSGSDDPVDRWYAAALVGGAWDDINRRQEVREIVRAFTVDEDADVAESARDFARWQAPDLLPQEDDLRPGEAWTRPRGYTLERLRRAADSLTPLNADTARSIFQRGDRALVMKAAHAGRFATDDLREMMFGAGEPGLLPMLVRRFESLEVANWAAWCSQVAACGPDGCRLLSAVARSADIPVRGFAIASLLACPWGSEFAAGAISDLAAQTGEQAEEALVYAVQNGGLAWRATLPRPVADALVRAALRLAAEGSSPDRVRRLVQNFGSQSLRAATPELLQSLAADPGVADAASAARAWIGDLPDINEKVMRGPTWHRSTALELLPGNRVVLLRSLLRAWILAGHHREQVEPYRIRAGWDELCVAILDEAAWDEPNREALMDLRSMIGRYAYGAVGQEAPPSLRPAEAPIPAEFCAPSYADRLSASWSFRTAPTSEGFARLSAAAFRGASGDEVAIDAVSARLGPDALPDILPLLGRPDPLVRAAAATAAGRAAGPAKNVVIAALLSALCTEKVDHTRLRMVAALARFGDHGALAILQELAGSEDPDLRLAVARTLPYSPTFASAAILAPLADDQDAVVREEAVAGLQTMTRREHRFSDPPFGRAAKWIEWLKANPGARLHDPPPKEQDYYDFYDW